MSASRDLSQSYPRLLLTLRLLKLLRRGAIIGRGKPRLGGLQRAAEGWRYCDCVGAEGESGFCGDRCMKLQGFSQCGNPANLQLSIQSQRPGTFQKVRTSWVRATPSQHEPALRSTRIGGKEAFDPHR